MYKLKVPAREFFNNDTQEFINIPEINLYLEHSLVAISKWESKYHKSFIDTDKTKEEMYDYIRMMVVGKEPDNSNFVYFIPNEKIKEISDYINDPMTATTVPKTDEKKGKKQILTSELIYYYMTALNIPFTCERWHLNRLLMLIEVCSFESQPKDKKKKKLTQADLATRRAQMAAARARYKK